MTHADFAAAKELIDAAAETYFDGAREDIRAALEDLYGDRPVTLQQLSATFRRGDMITFLRDR